MVVTLSESVAALIFFGIAFICAMFSPKENAKQYETRDKKKQNTVKQEITNTDEQGTANRVIEETANTAINCYDQDTPRASVQETTNEDEQQTANAVELKKENTDEHEAETQESPVKKDDATVTSDEQQKATSEHSDNSSSKEESLDALKYGLKPVKPEPQDSPRWVQFSSCLRVVCDALFILGFHFSNIEHPFFPFQSGSKCET